MFLLISSRQLYLHSDEVQLQLKTRVFGIHLDGKKKQSWKFEEKDGSTWRSRRVEML